MYYLSSSVAHSVKSNKNVLMTVPEHINGYMLFTTGIHTNYLINI